MVGWLDGGMVILEGVADNLGIYNIKVTEVKQITDC